jgi:hypothetical protein
MGVYDPEMEIVKDYDGMIWVHRVVLERYKVVDGYVIPYRYKVSWPYPAKDYEAWFMKDANPLARCIGVTREEFVSMLCVDDPQVRAEVYIHIGYYYGFDNFDSDPITLTIAELNERWA